MVRGVEGVPGHRNDSTEVGGTLFDDGAEATSHPGDLEEVLLPCPRNNPNKPITLNNPNSP